MCFILIACDSQDNATITCVNCGEENATNAKFCQSCGKAIVNSDITDNNTTDTNKTDIAFDVTKFSNITSQQLISILGQPDNITETNERGFTSFPCKLYDYENHELGFLRFDLINDKVTAISINGELPYNNGNVLDTLNVKIENDDHFSEGDMYKKWECPTDDIDLIHITIIDNEKDIYKSLSVEFDSRYYHEWNLPIFYGTISPGEYNVITQELIKSIFVSPKSADFPMLDWTYKRNDYYFLVESYVDVENYFGAEIRHYFSIVYYNDTQTIAYALLDGEVIANNDYKPTADIIKSMFENVGENTNPSNPSNSSTNNPSDEYLLYTNTDLPISLTYASKEILVNNIEYIFCEINENTCTFCISLDLTSDYNVQDFKIKFSLIGESTNTVREYTLDDVSVYGADGNYISLDGDFIGELPADDYTIVFEQDIECVHNYGLWQNEIPATCTATGTKGHYVCSVCHQYFDKSYSVIAEFSLPLIDHNYGNWVNEKASSCYETGILGHYSCSVCNGYFDGNFKQLSSITIDISHNYINNVCSSCDDIDYSTDLDFTISDNELYYIVNGIGTCTDEYIYIPPTYKNLPVTHIGERAFYTENGIKNIVLSEKITTIEKNAFYGSNLTSITISSGVNTIENSAFGNCGQLNSIDLPSSITTLGTSVFSMCSNLTNVKWSCDITTIPYSTFSWCTKLSTITISSSVEEIGEYAFMGCGSLTINIPKKLTSIGARAFSSLDSCIFNYEGNKGDWDNIVKGTDWIYGTSSYTIHCKDGDIVE